MKRTIRTSWIASMVAVTVVATLLSATPTESAAANTSGFRGINWAAPTDNFTTGAVVPSGLSTADSYATTYQKATSLLQSAAIVLEANTVRLPVNPHSVGNTWWNSYVGAIDAATALGFKVILGYWEGVYDGRIDDQSTWNSMWATIVAKYGNNSLVYYEPMNEPYGYNSTEWRDISKAWLDAYPALPRGQVIVSGLGYNTDIGSICNDSRLNGTLVSLHTYAFFGSNNYQGWLSGITNAIAQCPAARVIVDEFGAPQDSGYNYNSSYTDGTVKSQNFTAYFRAATDAIRATGVGSVYWAGIWTGDWYAMTNIVGTGTSLSLSKRNQSGYERLMWAWFGRGTSSQSTVSPPFNASAPVPFDYNVQLRLRNVTSGFDLDSGGSLPTSSPVKQWVPVASNNLRWVAEYVGEGHYRIKNVTNGLALDGNGATTNGALVIQSNYNGSANQQWRILDVGSNQYVIVNRATGLALDNAGSTTNGSQIIQWAQNPSNNQRWQFYLP